LEVLGQAGKSPIASAGFHNDKVIFFLQERVNRAMVNGSELEFLLAAKHVKKSYFATFSAISRVLKVR
jgi:hypothetical protein